MHRLISQLSSVIWEKAEALIFFILESLTWFLVGLNYLIIINIFLLSLNIYYLLLSKMPIVY